MIIIEVDVDPAYEDPHEVVADITRGGDLEHLADYCGNPVTLVSAEWIS